MARRQTRTTLGLSLGRCGRETRRCREIVSALLLGLVVLGRNALAALLRVDHVSSTASDGSRGGSEMRRAVRVGWLRWSAHTNGSLVPLAWSRSQIWSPTLILDVIGMSQSLPELGHTVSDHLCHRCTPAQRHQHRHSLCRHNPGRALPLASRRCQRGYRGKRAWPPPNEEKLTLPTVHRASGRKEPFVSCEIDNKGTELKELSKCMRFVGVGTRKQPRAGSG